MTTSTLSHWIAGQARPPAGGEFLDDVAPATGAVIARVPRGDRRDVDAAVQAAHAALHGPAGDRSAGDRPAGNGPAGDGPLAKLTLVERARLLEATARRLEARKDELAQLESLDTGKPVSTAATIDIPRAVANFEFFAGALRHDRSDCFPMDGALNYALRRPLGVVGLVTPWNLPLYLLSWKAAPALAMGNAVVAKPSELTPLTASALAELLTEVGWPAGAFNLVHGLGPEAGQALVEHPRVAAISFTGGTATGARVAATAAPMFKKLSLELGGKNPTIVFGDVDLDVAVAGALRAGFTNQGQVCLCGSRVLVERRIFDRFSDAFVQKVLALRTGDPRDGKTDLGALVSLAHRDKVEGFLRLAREEGGTVHGGLRPDLGPALKGGAFLTPAVVTGLPADCRTATEEIFGPVVTLHPFDDEAEAVALANGVRYGLSASIWTNDLARAHRVAAQVEAGVVWINTWLLRDLRTPFGGVKDSGVGREGGAHSLDFFSEWKNVCVKL